MYKTKYVLIILILISVNGFTKAEKQSTQILSERLSEHIRNRIEAAGSPPRLKVGEEQIYASIMLPIFYERRIYRAAWIYEKGPSPQVNSLIKAISKADHEGLTPYDYHLQKIENILNEVNQNIQKKIPVNLRRLVDLDLLLTDAFLIYGAHLLRGRINPETIDPEWNAILREANLAEILENAINSNKIEEALKSLLPPQSGYNRLRQALFYYKNIITKGGWISIPEGSKLQKGDIDNRVKDIRNNLFILGDYKKDINLKKEFFDDTLEVAVYRFQQRHGLETDGVVGKATLAALNITPEQRIRQIEINMERWRWLPESLGDRYIIINIANFELDVFENKETIMTLRAIVGKPYRRTPVFSDKITYLVLSPYWHIPPNIAIKDILPSIQRDPDYLTKHKIKVFKGWGTETKEIDPTTINWLEINEKNFNFRFRQEPGLHNALGRIKFMFPNKYDVYIHDTPSKDLFAKTERGFSSGCIRIEKPIELATYLLRDTEIWTYEKITTEIDKNVEKTVKLPEPINIHLLYWTVWVDDNENIQIRNDIYGRDKLLEEALYQPPPKE